MNRKPEPDLPDSPDNDNPYNASAPPQWEMVYIDQVKQEQMNRIEQLVKQTLKMESLDLLDDLAITTNFNGLKIKMTRGKNVKPGWKRAVDGIYTTIEHSVVGIGNGINRIYNDYQGNR
jgi:hypothetical protein